MIDLSKFDSLISLATYFDTESKCKKVLRERRWGKYIVCPYCGSIKCVERTDGKYRCKECGSNFSETVGTIFENTKIPLRKWFMAMYLISSHKKGVSSVQLA